MSGEIIAIVAVGVTLAGLILTSNRDLRQDIKQLEERLRAEIAKAEERLGDNIQQLADRVGRLEERVARVEYSQAKLEGLLEGLREAVTGRVARSRQP